MVKSMTKRSSRRGSNARSTKYVGLIYANWCGHCQQLRPHWDKMKQNIDRVLLRQNGEIIELEDSDPGRTEKMRQIHPDLDVAGYPTIFKVTKDGKLHMYDGERIATKLTEWAISDKPAKTSQNNRTVFNNHVFGGFIFKKPTSPKKTAKKRAKLTKKTNKTMSNLKKTATSNATNGV
jgi:thiol-disulfide isomerase/thioredoxin